MNTIRAISYEPTLLVSFWNICFENLPIGSFTHREIPAEFAHDLIAQARTSGGLLCLSDGELFAASNEEDRHSYLELCEVLRKQFDIHLSLADFACEDKDDQGETLYWENVRELRKINGRCPLLVIQALFAWQPKEERSVPLSFKVAEDSVRFHLFELVA